MESIVVFNNKGGVGKTTFLCNLASYLQKFCDKKIIVVDADPQSNATTYSLDETQIVEIYSKPSSQLTLRDIFNDLRKTGSYFTKTIPIIRSPRFSYDLIPGDPDISLYEDFLSKDWFEGIGGEPRGLKTTLIFQDLNARLEKLGYDLVLYDVGPSIGAINRSVLLSADFFILPMSSDIFSLRAIENIKTSLDQWKSEFTEGLDKYEKKEKEKYSLANNEVRARIKFLGYITQQYMTKTRLGKKSVVKAYDNIIREIPKTIEKHLGPLNSPNGIDDYRLGEIPILFSLVPLSQSANAPIFDLGADDGVVGAHFSKVKEFKEIIAEISKKTIRNMEALS